MSLATHHQHAPATSQSLHRESLATPCRLAIIFQRALKFFLLLVLCLIISLGATQQARAQIAALDQSFGNGGKTHTDFIMKDEGASGIALQADGKIVVVGNVIQSTTEIFPTLADKNAPAGNNRSASPGSALSNGAGGFIVITNQDFVVARYNMDGTLDQSFGTIQFPITGLGGYVLTDFGAVDTASCVAIQPDGKIVVGGQTTATSGLALARYNSDGSLDTSFGNGGKIAESIANIGSANAIVIQPDGKIVVAGNGFLGSGVARYTTDGIMDRVFDTDPLYRGYWWNAVALQPDGKIVVGGAPFDGSTFDAGFVVGRYNSDGSIDGGFSIFGKVYTPPATPPYGGSSQGHISSLLIQPNGSIVAGGFTQIKRPQYIPPDPNTYVPLEFYSDFILLGYTSSGAPDTSFGRGGSITLDFSDLYTPQPQPYVNVQLDSITGLFPQPGGKFLAVGYATVWTGATNMGVPAFARYNANGTPDTSFGTGGRSAIISPDIYAGGRPAMQRDGKIVFASSTSEAQTVDFALERIGFVQDDIFKTALYKYVPVLRYDSQEYFFALAAEAITDNPGNKLVGNSGVIARNPATSTIPLLNLNFLGNTYPNGLLAHSSDRVVERHDDTGPRLDDYRIDASRFQNNPRYAERIYGRVYYGLDSLGQPRAWLQYWFFYYYNDFITYGHRFDHHEGDWEMIQIALDSNAQPLSAVFAQHKKGSQCRWSGVEKGGIYVNRPVVYVARGSHASYFHAGDYDLHFIKDKDHANGLVTRAEPTLVLISETSPNWMNWPGHWGGTQKPKHHSPFPFPIGFDFTLFFDGDSPRGPKFQSGSKWSSPPAYENSIPFGCR